MTSMTFKRAAAVVTLATSLAIGGAAFASPASARTPGNDVPSPAVWGYDPVGAVGDAYAAVVYKLNERNREQR
jgi:hypothetical protein